MWLEAAIMNGAALGCCDKWKVNLVKPSGRLLIVRGLRTLPPQCRGWNFEPWSDPHTATRARTSQLQILRAVTKTHSSQRETLKIKKKKPFLKRQTLIEMKQVMLLNEFQT